MIHRIEEGLKDETLGPLVLNRLKLIKKIEENKMEKLWKLPREEKLSFLDQDTGYETFLIVHVKSFFHDFEKFVRNKRYQKKSLKFHWKKIARFVFFEVPPGVDERIDILGKFEDSVKVNLVGDGVPMKKN